jgi:hypothetical protein
LAPPVSAFEFKVSKLQLSDFEVLDNYILALDYYQGIFLFEYYADSVHKLKQLKFNDLYFTLKFANGISAGWNNGYIMLILMTDVSIYVL